LTDTINDAATAEPATPSPKKDEGGWLAELRNLAILLLIVLGIHSFVAKPFYIPSASMMPGLLKGDRLVVSKYPYGWSYASVSFHLMPPFAGRLFGSTPERGDIVIVEPNGVRTDYIKRVIGLPGDVIEVRAGRLFLNGVAVPAEVRPVMTIAMDLNIDDPADEQDGCTGREVRGRNGEPLCELQIVRETLPNGVTYDTVENGFNPATEQYGPYTVPAGHVFLMGDNRDHSADSRFASSAQDPYAVGLGGSVPLEQIGGRAEFITFSLDGSSQWYNPLSWFTAMRSGRAGDSLRPERGTPPRRAVAGQRPAAPPAN
jgi:signal peptidase I